MCWIQLEDQERGKTNHGRITGLNLTNARCTHTRGNYRVITKLCESKIQKTIENDTGIQLGSVKSHHMKTKTHKVITPHASVNKIQINGITLDHLLTLYIVSDP